jgi:hypothetical protein
MGRTGGNTMSHNINLERIPTWVANNIRKCKECRTYPDNTALVCGWHENLTAGARAVETAANNTEL